jgi:hypothetical protein
VPLPNQTSFLEADGQADGEPPGRRDPLSPGESDGAPVVPVPAPGGQDPFDDLEALRIPQDFAGAIGGKPLLKEVPVRKPSKEAWIRVCPDPAFRLVTGVIELKDDSEYYLVTPNLWPALSAEKTFSARLLVLTIDRRGILTIWPLRPPALDRRDDRWSRSARDAAEEAQHRWVRVQANTALGGYETVPSLGDFGDPTWPDLPFKVLLRIAFRDRVISDPDHPVIRRLDGRDI